MKNQALLMFKMDTEAGKKYKYIVAIQDYMKVAES